MDPPSRVPSPAAGTRRSSDPRQGTALAASAIRVRPAGGGEREQPVERTSSASTRSGEIEKNCTGTSNISAFRRSSTRQQVLVHELVGQQRTARAATSAARTTRAADSVSDT